MKKNNFVKIAAGGVVGFVCGLFGGGGGMLVVPVLQHFFGYKAKNSHATAIAIILPLTVVAAIFYLFNTKIEFQTCLTVCCGVFVGGIAGAFLLKKISSEFLSFAFSVIMLIAGAKLLFF